jgi:hypothetical protein
MATSKISVSEGSGKNLATHSISEDAVTKEIQRVSITDADGASVVADGGVLVNFNATVYTTSTVNSTVAQLSAGATFTGTVESVFNEPNIQVMVFCDQPYTVSVLQYIDAGGTKLINTKIFTRQANAPLNESLMLAGNYYKITLQNTGSSATTTLQLSTTLGNLPVTPIGLTNTGNLPVETPSKQTYKASTIIPLVTAVTANVPFFNIIGSATKTISIKKISVNGHTLTAVAYTTINVEKLSTASSGGTSTTLVAVPLDSANGTATAVVKAYTVAPTRGTLVGTISSQRILSQATVAVASGITTDFEFKYGDFSQSSPVVLRGATQELCLTYPVALTTAGTCAIDIEWTEE